MKRYAFFLPVLLVGLIIGGLLVASLRVGDWFRGPDPETIAAASLQSVREQARLTPFSARFVAVVTSTQRRFGLSAEKTLIMPGTVRYELDLAKLRQQDMDWDDTTKILSISLPPLEISAPQIDPAEVREYGGGGLLGTLTDAEKVLDASNRQAGQVELKRQAMQAMPLRLARDAARRAVERSFAMPLKAAGIDDATVNVRFRDEGRTDPSQLDRSRRIEDVLRERQGAK
ncbi:DUF4230 domain-containing protein [Sphingosinicella sp. BN140058]|uniref:DUF4230 domain-containing protein n=1 Tax=Sphingosinicella sp. BN140058 TaxID=1892855 RepID=UPI001012B3BC|nr:DUF4230 domain-containing protein [Sphingosinicella sp. BN140058]QAY78521.1 DUF4230 domain-containing protein [Sphingosinicella sp. BN140058]